MPHTVYFAGAVRVPGPAKEHIPRMIGFIKSLGHEVLSEHIGADNPQLAFAQKTGKLEFGPVDVRMQDIAWLEQSTHVVAELSGPSTGVGAEIEHALLQHLLGKTKPKILGLYQIDHEPAVSWMVRGNEDERLTLYPYSSEPDWQAVIHSFLSA